jgi:hypothetical protein
VINFNELSGAVPERKKIKQLLIQEGASGSSFQKITLVLSDESLLDLQKLLVKAYDTGYNSGFNEGEAVMQDTLAFEFEQEYKKGWSDDYAEARDEYR